MAAAIKVIDSHTGGEPTRIVYQGGPDLGTGSLPSRAARFRELHDDFRRAVVLEPRGSDVLVGGLLTPPTDPACVAGIIFFNNLDYLGMCGHGLIGLMATLKHLGRVQDGQHQIETPVGVVTAEIRGHETSVVNVPSFRSQKDVSVKVPEYGTVVGDVAWGGNWFFLVKQAPVPLQLEHAETLTRFAIAIRVALSEQNITGDDDAWIDHVELFAEPFDKTNDSRNFVLCPGGAFDRSPCGTGTSAKLACLAADGSLAPGQTWRQESIIGSVFTGSYQWNSETNDSSIRQVIPTIRGTAFVSGEATLILHPEDPFRAGIRG